MKYNKYIDGNPSQLYEQLLGIKFTVCQRIYLNMHIRCLYLLKKIKGSIEDNINKYSDEVVSKWNSEAQEHCAMKGNVNTFLQNITNVCMVKMTC